MNQTLPNSTEAEQALISSMLSYSNSVQTAVELGLHAEDFTWKHTNVSMV